MTRAEVITALKARITSDYNQADMAKDCGVSAAMISDVLHGRKSPPPKVLALLGLQRTIVYMPSAANPMTHTSDAEREIAKLRAENERLRDVAEWFEAQRVSASLRAAVDAPEDADVLAMCRRFGFGAVMDSASRQWVRQDGRGAFFIGGCVGDHTARAALNPQEAAQ